MVLGPATKLTRQFPSGRRTRLQVLTRLNEQSNQTLSTPTRACQRKAALKLASLCVKSELEFIYYLHIKKSQHIP